MTDNGLATSLEYPTGKVTFAIDVNFFNSAQKKTLYLTFNV